MQDLTDKCLQRAQQLQELISSRVAAIFDEIKEFQSAVQERGEDITAASTQLGADLEEAPTSVRDKQGDLQGRV